MDLIDRRAAIEALTKDKKALEHIINGMSGHEKEFDRFVGQRNQIDCDIYAIRQLPPAEPEPSQVAEDIARIVENGQDMRVIAQPERIKGHWINGHCDKCNAHAPFWAMASTYYESNFCHNCGADMRGEQDG